MKSVDERYADLVLRWIDHDDEPALLAAARALGEELDEQGVPRAALEEIHAAALRRVAAAAADVPAARLAPRVAELMLEIGRSYDAARRRRTSARSVAAEAQGGFADDEFLGLLTHEMRTPLSPILTWAELLRAESLDAAEAAAAIDSIERNARALQAMIDDLSVAARSTSGRLPHTPECIDLAPLIAKVVDEFAGEAEGGGVVLEHRVEGPLPLRGDPRQLRQVVRNLVGNAVKFTAHGGRVAIDARREGEVIRLVVSDTGRGIGATDLSRIFDDVWPVSSAVTRRHRGLGLGLVVVHRLVRLHGGSIVAESAGMGRGATFAVEFPGASHEADAAGARSRVALPGDLAGTRILLVDDEPDAIDAASALLAHWGVEVRTVASAEEALGALATFSPDVLISDLAMPRHDGYALMLAIRDTEAKTGSARLPAIALTAHSREQERRKAISVGFDGVVAKPIESGELLETLGLLLSQR